MSQLYKAVFILYVCLLSLSACKKHEEDHQYIWKSLKVTATAYTTFPSQTSKIHPNISAWGDTLKPGMKVIAVSRDLISMGLVYNTPIKIEGDTSIFLVKDKMHAKWKKRIDIYMGDNKEKAIQWGRKKITIRYRVKKDALVVK